MTKAVTHGATAFVYSHHASNLSPASRTHTAELSSSELFQRILHHNRTQNFITTPRSLLCEPPAYQGSPPYAPECRHAQVPRENAEVWSDSDETPRRCHGGIARSPMHAACSPVQNHHTYNALFRRGYPADGNKMPTTHSAPARCDASQPTHEPPHEE